MNIYKVGRPFNLTAAEELKTISYITKPQSTGFGLVQLQLVDSHFRLRKIKVKLDLIK
jgi:hypothetical protein